VEQYTQHATAVAREVVRRGLAQQEQVLPLFQEYSAFLQRGVRASFTQLLVSRGVIDAGAGQTLDQLLPLASMPSPATSNSAPQPAPPPLPGGAPPLAPTGPAPPATDLRVSADPAADEAEPLTPPATADPGFDTIPVPGLDGLEASADELNVFGDGDDRLAAAIAGFKGSQGEAPKPEGDGGSEEADGGAPSPSAAETKARDPQADLLMSESSDPDAEAAAEARAKKKKIFAAGAVGGLLLLASLYVNFGGEEPRRRKRPQRPRPVKTTPTPDPPPDRADPNRGNTGSSSGGGGSTEDPAYEDVPAPPSRPEGEIRQALEPSEPKGPSGAEEARDTNTAPEQLQALLFRFDGGVAAAAAVGDLRTARSALRALQRDPDVRGVNLFCREVESDLETLSVLRELVLVRLREDPSLLRRPQLHDGDLLPGTEATIEGELLRFEGRGTRVLVDPLSLDLNSLAQAVLRPREKPESLEVSDAGAHFALALLGMFRAEGVLTKHFDAAGDDPAVARRRTTAEWLEASRRSVWKGYHKAAQAAWKQLEGHTDKGSDDHRRALEAFVHDFCASTTWRSKRSAWVAAMAELEDLGDLLAGKASAEDPGVSWTFQRDQLGDFELLPVDEDQPFRAGVPGDSLSLQNGRARFTLGDLVVDEASLGLSSQDGQEYQVFLGPIGQRLHPESGWSVELKGKVLAQDDEQRSLDEALTLEFQRKADQALRVFRLEPATLEVPEETFSRLRPGKDDAFGVESPGQLSLTSAALSWTEAANPEGAHALRQALLARRLLLREAEVATGSDGFARLLLAPGDQGDGLLLTAGWRPRRGVVDARERGDGAAWLWTMRGTGHGVLTFEAAWGAGPGVRLHVSSTAKGAKAGETSWLLPGVLEPDPAAFRQVTCRFNVGAKVMAVEVDGLRLGAPRRLPSRTVYFGIELMEGTPGQVRNLRLVTFEPR
jgi:hypothetical protein